MDQLPKRNWWSRNWKWVVTTGCLTLVLIFACFVALIFFSALTLMKSSEVYKDALAIAKNNDEAKALLGEPIEEGLMFSGSIETSGSTGKADIAIPLSGPKGSATLYVVATKTAGRWYYSILELEPKESKARINLRSQLQQ